MSATPGVDDWRSLHTYWFADLDEGPGYMPSRLPIWFFAAPEADATIKAEYAPWLDTITDAVKAAWKKDQRSFLALIVLIDQIPRNAFRGTPQAFAHDELGLELADEFFDRGLDAGLTPIELFFAYLPFQHQEDMVNQDRQLKGILAQVERAPEGHAKFFGIARDMAVRHHTAIERFGRFPHRNAILGRPPTVDEAAFLDDPKNHF